MCFLAGRSEGRLLHHSGLGEDSSKLYPVASERQWRAKPDMFLNHSEFQGAQERVGAVFLPVCGSLPQMASQESKLLQSMAYVSDGHFAERPEMEHKRCAKMMANKALSSAQKIVKKHGCRCFAGFDLDQLTVVTFSVAGCTNAERRITGRLRD